MNDPAAESRFAPDRITTFEELLAAARKQAEPQRLLFVFAQSGIGHNANPEQQRRHAAGRGGELTPVLCVDKPPEAVRDFAQMVEESRHTGQDWHIAFVAAMADHRRYLPDNKDVEGALEDMVARIRQGLVGAFIAFDRRGEPLLLSHL